MLWSQGLKKVFARVRCQKREVAQARITREGALGFCSYFHEVELQQILDQRAKDRPLKENQSESRAWKDNS